MAGIKAIEIRQINLFKSGGSSRLVNVRVTDFILTIIWGGIITSNICGEHNKDNVKNKILQQEAHDRNIKVVHSLELNKNPI